MTRICPDCGSSNITASDAIVWRCYDCGLTARNRIWTKEEKKEVKKDE